MCPVSTSSSVQFSHSVVSDSLWPHGLQQARQASLSITSSRSPLKLMSIESVMPSSHLILCRPLLLLPPIPPSIRIFSNESTLRMRWPKYWSFSFSIIPSKEHPGLISFRMDWLDLFAVQGTLKSLLQHHSSKASILRRSAFFTVQLSLLLEFTQTHVHWVGDAIQPSHPLSSPSPPAPNPSQHHSLFQWVNSSHEERGYFQMSCVGYSNQAYFTNIFMRISHWTLQPF